MQTTMKPDPSVISITDNVTKIKSFLADVILEPRLRMFEWSRITNQTPNLKIGYPGQHLASLVTGVPGTATGARGEDILDGTEVKSCSRLDQVDTCRDCGSHVMRIQSACPHCGSTNVDRKNDSKWLFAIRSEDELDLYLKIIPRTLLLIADYPDFDSGNYSTLRFATYEIWNQSERASNFRKLLVNYYRKIYRKHIRSNPNKTPAPKNFWPYSYQFFLCNPIKTFECFVRNADTSPTIDVTLFIPPSADRRPIPSEGLPVNLLQENEKRILKRHGIDVELLSTIDEESKNLLPLRDTSDAKPHKSKYIRPHSSKS